MMDDDEHGAVSAMIRKETEVLAENIPPYRFFHHKSHMT
jgi:hypothetical protein